ncbi:cAMP-responsive element-binding partner-like 2 [Octopus vulgaris]|uniref:cAMP-responsive element-binding partner-like 2 n=2 Tax=Octopus TaxID=6643 RepID=A0AA36F2A0_OCTVU|nr:cAMP-responsive element-binding partner-like 2 [Octopus vulgaris]
MSDPEFNLTTHIQDEEARIKKMSAERPVKRAGRRGRKPSKIDQKARLERSRQSARECRARKKLRYQYLEELVVLRERSIFSLRDELERLKVLCSHLDNGIDLAAEVKQSILNTVKESDQKRLSESLNSPSD